MKLISTKLWNDLLTNDEIFYHSKDIENFDADIGKYNFAKK